MKKLFYLLCLLSLVPFFNIQPAKAISYNELVLEQTSVNVDGLGSASGNISLNPNPILVCDGSTYSTVTVNAYAAVSYEVRIDSPTGTLFSLKAAKDQLSQSTGNWVTNGMNFYLVDSINKTVLAHTKAVFSQEGCNISNRDSVFNTLKSVTWYEFGPTFEQSMKNLQVASSEIKKAGFNAVWIVVPWAELNPKPLATFSQYNDASFKVLKDTVDILKNQNIKIMFGLNYLGNGWAPEGIDYCNWISNSQMYNSFEKYVQEVMSRFLGYENDIYFLVFTENAENCLIDTYTNAKNNATALRATLGSLPSRLPTNLKGKFKIGYHDYNLINLNWAEGETPILFPNAFDFVSMVAYDLEKKKDFEINSEILLRAKRFKNLYPNTPLVLGEFGARSCSSVDDYEQARVLVSILKTADELKMGYNLWGWKPTSVDACSKLLSGYGYYIVGSDGLPRISGKIIASFLGGSIGPVVPETDSTVVYLLNSIKPTTTPIDITPPYTNKLNFPSGTLVNERGTIYFISGHSKIPFTNWQAFVGLGYVLKNVVIGSLDNYVKSETYFITSSNQDHPWGSWLLYNGTVFYAHESGLIGVPSYEIFLQNGGNLKYLVKANKQDIAVLNSKAALPVMESNDSRIYK